MNFSSRLTTRPIPQLPNNFVIQIRKPDEITHELSTEVEVFTINDFYMDICTLANFRILEVLDSPKKQYICAIENSNKSDFCLGINHYDDYLNLDVIKLYSLVPNSTN